MSNEARYAMPDDRPISWLRKELDGHRLRYDAITFNEYDGRLYLRIACRDTGHKWLCDFIEQRYPEFTFDSVISDINGWIHCDYRAPLPEEAQPAEAAR